DLPVHLFDIAVVDVLHEAALAEVLGDHGEHLVFVLGALAASTGSLLRQVVAHVAVDEVPYPGRGPRLDLREGRVLAPVDALAQLRGLPAGGGDGPRREGADGVALLDPGDPVGDQERPRTLRVTVGRGEDAEGEALDGVLVPGVPD